MPVSTGEFLFVLVMATILSLVVFTHAERHGNRRATAWGITTFFFGFLGVAVYFTRHWARQRAR